MGTPRKGKNKSQGDEFPETTAWSETFIHHYQTFYADAAFVQKGNANYAIGALFATADIHLTGNLNAEASSRVNIPASIIHGITIHVWL